MTRQPKDSSKKSLDSLETRSLIEMLGGFALILQQYTMREVVKLRLELKLLNRILFDC